MVTLGPDATLGAKPRILIIKGACATTPKRWGQPCYSANLNLSTKVPWTQKRRIQVQGNCS